MKVEEFNGVQFYISDDIYADDAGSTRFAQSRKELLLKICEKPLAVLKKEGIIFDTTKKSPVVLHAHGGLRDDVWTFADDQDEMPVQDWINQMDGKYDPLLIQACNGEKSEISSKHSVVIHANARIKFFKGRNGYHRIPFTNSRRLYIPGSGYLA